MNRMLSTLLLVLLPICVQAATDANSWNFKVYLDEKPVGFHTFSIQDEGLERVLKSEARFDVDFFIFNAYSYRHDTRERWKGDCLNEFESSTDDNGEKFSVRGNAGKDNFRVMSNKGPVNLPACVMTFAYWNPEMLTQKRLLNPQNGEYVSVKVEKLGDEKIKVRGRDEPAYRYRLKTEKFLIDLWYSPDQRWLALDSTLENGSRLRYRIE